MPTLTYWVATCMDDARAYSLRAKTRKECRQLLADMGRDDGYSEPHKVTVSYEDGFDLMTQCLGEGGGYWEELY